MHDIGSDPVKINSTVRESPAQRSGGKRPRKGPGRPEASDANLREEIMDSAEAVFAELGYAGTTLRQIADRAKVAQGLINYYFGSKYALFEATFFRRSKEISAKRILNLNALLETGKKLRLRQIIEAFLMPTLELRSSASGRAFLRLQARLHTEPPEISYPLRNDAYDFSTRLYVQAIQAALPRLEAKQVYWRMTLMIGAYMYAFSDTHRLDQLAPGVCNVDDPHEVIEQITAFVVGGFEAK